jgi:aminoglycoside N3'-acetyltransferase
VASGLPQTQVLLVHAKLAKLGQAAPQAPQLLESFVVSIHVPPQSVNGTPDEFL